MNLSHFSTQRQIAALRIDTINGSMKGYHKAHELKSKSPRHVDQASLGLSTSFPSGVSSYSSRRPVSSETLTPTHSAAENHNHGSAKKTDKYCATRETRQVGRYQKATGEHFYPMPHRPDVHKAASQESRHSPLSSILEDLGVDYLGN